MSIKVCLTGSTGFIGQNLIPLLTQDKELEVVPFIGNLLKQEEVDSFFKKHSGITHVVHLAGAFSGSSAELIQANVETTATLLDVATKHGVKKVVYTSTGAVYGEPVGKESFEDDPLLPNTFYGQVKLWGEETVQFYNRNNDLAYTILRFPNVYGPNNQKGVIHHFLSDIKTKGEITLYGDGTQSRNFLHVSDASQAISLAIKSSSKTGVFNISNPVKTSLNDLTELLKKDYTFTVKHLPANNLLKDLLLNIDLAQKKLGFQPKITKLRTADII